MAVDDLPGDGDAAPPRGVCVDSSPVADIEINVVEPARFEYSDQRRLDMRVIETRQAPKPTHHPYGDALAGCASPRVANYLVPLDAYSLGGLELRW